MIILLAVPAPIWSLEQWQILTPADLDLYALWGSTDDDIYAAGQGNTLLYFDGLSWEQVPQIESNTPIVDIMAVWGVPSVEVIAAGGMGTIFMNDGLRWLKFGSITSNTINAVWGSSSTNIFAVGASGTILTSDGTSWRLLTPSITPLNLYCIWGSSEDNVFAGGELGKLLYYDGLSWDTISLEGITSQDLRAIWGSSASDIYAAGTYGQIIHYDGSAWSLVASSGVTELYAMWGSDGNDIFVVGKNGAVYHFNGTAWSKMASPAAFDINAVWGSTSGKVYFAGQNGQILVLSRDDIIAPLIGSTTTSKDNEGKVYIDTPITFNFSEKMDPATINGTTLTLKSGATPVHGSVTLSADAMTATLNGDLEFSTTYTATVASGSSGVKDKSGNSLTSDYTLTFTIEDEPDAEPGSGSDSGCFISSARM